MNIFFYILINIIFPIFSLIAVGFTAQKKLKIDIGPITKISIYIFSPAMIFVKLYHTEFGIELFAILFIYSILIMAFLFIISEVMSKLLNYSKSMAKAFTNSIMLFNSGNYGLPLIQLVFNNDPLAVSAQVFLFAVQNITTNTFGVFQASLGKSTYKTAFKKTLKMPSVYAILAVVIIKITGFKVPDEAMVPLEYIAKGFIALVLILLGMQLAEIKIDIKVKDILIPVFTRLVLSPVMGYFLVSAMGIKGILAPVLVLGVATPTAVNSVIIANEFDNEPEYASQICFISTALSVVTVTIIIFLIKKFM